MSLKLPLDTICPSLPPYSVSVLDARAVSGDFFFGSDETFGPIPGDREAGVDPPPPDSLPVPHKGKGEKGQVERTESRSSFRFLHFLTPNPPPFSHAVPLQPLSFLLNPLGSLCRALSPVFLCPCIHTSLNSRPFGAFTWGFVLTAWDGKAEEERQGGSDGREGFRWASLTQSSRAP